MKPISGRFALFPAYAGMDRDRSVGTHSTVVLFPAYAGMDRTT